MNTRSYLCRFLADNPGQWETVLWNDYRIRVKKEDNYAIFNYVAGCDFSDPVTQEARGIILDTEKLEVVCWPFRKFGNFNESYADAIDWSTARVQEKVDGSIVKLWYDERNNKWQFSTNATIRAEDAPVGEFSKTTFAELIAKADNFGDIHFDELDRDVTYIFELVSPDAKVVVPYESTRLYHTGTRHNRTGEETDADIGIIKPRMYPIHSLAECVETAVRLNRTASDEILAEGFVAVDGKWNRVKVKSPDYIAKHNLMQIRSIPKKKCVQMIMAASDEIEKLCRVNPELIPVFKFYDYHLARLRHLADRIGDLTRQLYDEYSGDRAAVAKIISRHPLAYIGFGCIENDRRGSELFGQMPQDHVCRMIPEYEEEDLSELFLKK